MSPQTKALVTLIVGIISSILCGYLGSLILMIFIPTFAVLFAVGVYWFSREEEKEEKTPKSERTGMILFSNPHPSREKLLPQTTLEKTIEMI